MEVGGDAATHPTQLDGARRVQAGASDGDGEVALGTAVVGDDGGDGGRVIGEVTDRERCATKRGVPMVKVLFEA